MQIELLDRQRWKTRVELSDAIYEFIELFACCSQDDPRLCRRRRARNRSLSRTVAVCHIEILAHHRAGASNGPIEGLNLCVKKVKLRARTAPRVPSRPAASHPARPTITTADHPRSMRSPAKGLRIHRRRGEARVTPVRTAGRYFLVLSHNWLVSAPIQDPELNPWIDLLLTTQNELLHVAIGMIQGYESLISWACAFP